MFAIICCFPEGRFGINREVGPPRQIRGYQPTYRE
jgi:hypothetical protein